MFTDRRHGDEAVAEVEDAIERMKAYEQALKIEVQERRTLIELLRHGETFYENERGEAKVVFNVSVKPYYYPAVLISDQCHILQKPHLHRPQAHDLLLGDIPQSQHVLRNATEYSGICEGVRSVTRRY